MTHIYFESNGLMVSNDLREAFFDSILQESLYMVPYAGVFMTALFFLGHYISHLLLRPFKFISDYTLKIYQGPDQAFSPDYISEFKLPISFGVHFFEFLNQGRKNKTLSATEVGSRYARINRPIFDSVFFIHYSLLLGLACVIASWGLYLFTVDMHANIVELSLKSLKQNNLSLVHFLNGQKEILETVIMFTSLLTVACYAYIGKSIVEKVNGVSYNFFKTMRDFMQGNFSARVVLRKNDPAHSYANSFNTLLDHVVKDEVTKLEGKKKEKAA